MAAPELGNHSSSWAVGRLSQGAAPPTASSGAPPPPRPRQGLTRPVGVERALAPGQGVLEGVEEVPHDPGDDGVVVVAHHEGHEHGRNAWGTNRHCSGVGERCGDERSGPDTERSALGGVSSGGEGPALGGGVNVGWGVSAGGWSALGGRGRPWGEGSRCGYGVGAGGGVSARKELSGQRPSWSVWPLLSPDLGGEEGLYTPCVSIPSCPGHLGLRMASAARLVPGSRE